VKGVFLFCSYRSYQRRTAAELRRKVFPDPKLDGYGTARRSVVQILVKSATMSNFGKIAQKRPFLAM
jgi:hypothetical protein